MTERWKNIWLAILFIVGIAGLLMSACGGYFVAGMLPTWGQRNNYGVEYIALISLIVGLSLLFGAYKLIKYLKRKTSDQ